MGAWTRVRRLPGLLALAGLLQLAAPVRAQPATPPSTPPALPALGEGGDLDVRAERRLGDRIARELYRDPDFIDDPVVSDHLQGLWRPLLAAARARGEIAPEIEERFVWEVMLGRDRSINAFALPGGYLGVHLGLIAASANRDELASVLAHELSHVTQRHIARMMTQSNQQAPLVLGAMILGALAASNNPQAAGAVIAGAQAAALQGQLNYSRDMEREADRVGMGILVQAGFDPQGFVSLFEKLQLASRLNDSGAFPYLRTHPLTTERIADMQSRVQAVQGAATGATSPAPGALEHWLVAARSRVLSQMQVDALRARVAEAQPGASAAGAPTAGALYAAALASVKLRDFGAADSYAQRLAQEVQSHEGARRLALMLRVEIALEHLDLLGAGGARAGTLERLPASGPAQAAGAIEGVLRSLEPLLAQWPLPADALQAQRAHWLLWARAQAVLGQADQAASRLQTWVALHPRDALAWQQLAQVQHARGQVLRAIRAEAEAQVARLDHSAALDRLRAAQDLLRQPPRAGAAPVDHIEASIIDTRAREVAALLREQALQR